MCHNLANNISNDSIGHKVIERRPACHLSGEITTFSVIKRVTLRLWREVPAKPSYVKSGEAGWEGRKLSCGFNSLAQLLKIEQADVSGLLSGSLFNMDVSSMCVCVCTFTHTNEPVSKPKPPSLGLFGIVRGAPLKSE